jgi:hypothetical protein
MSSERQQYTEELLAISPWFAFFLAILWSSISEWHENRAARTMRNETPADMVERRGVGTRTDPVRRRPRAES